MGKFSPEGLFCPTQLAKDIGVIPAMILDRLNLVCGWRNSGVVLEDGKKWIFNTYEQWRENHFGFMSERIIQASFIALEKAGLIHSCQPEGGKSRRKYYRISETAEHMLRPSEIQSVRAAMGYQPDGGHGAESALSPMLGHGAESALSPMLGHGADSARSDGADSAPSCTTLCNAEKTTTTASGVPEPSSPADPWEINDQQSKRDRGAAQAGLPKTGDRKNRKNVKSLEKADPRFATCVSGYCAAYKSVLGATYGFLGGQDGSALRVLLTQIPDTSEEISQLAKAALKHFQKNPKAWNCGHAATLHGFCQKLNQIRAELAAAGISCKEPVYMESDPDAPTMQQFTNRNFRATLQAALSDPSVSEDRKASARNLLSTLPVL